MRGDHSERSGQGKNILRKRICEKTIMRVRVQGENIVRERVHRGEHR